MSADPTDLLFRVTGGGVSAKHPPREPRTVRVSPTTDDEFNLIIEELHPVACVRLDDVRFEFDSSFVAAQAIDEFQSLHALRAEITGMAVSVFGHADPVGDDTYNKQLSGRRAQAVYALLTRKAELWDDLFLNPQGRDNWKWKAIQSMLTTLKFYDGDINGQLDANTRKAIGDFQDSPKGAGSKPDPSPFPKTRKLIYLAYMDTICVDESGKPFQLDPVNDFLAGAADKKGKGDYQGCSEFNPVLVFSKKENSDFESAPDKTDRDKENSPNRRVLLFLFAPGKHVKLDRWPCPRAKEGFALCRKQFFKSKPTGDERRAFQEQHREYKDTKDTFACRFYDRLALESPCEIGPAVQSQLVRVHLRLLYRDPEGKPHVFPQDFPVGVLLASGTDPETHKVEADGLVTFNVERSKLPLLLTFPTDGTQFIANATAATKGPGPERLITQDGLKDALADSYRVFKMPIRVWDLDTSEWSDGTKRVTRIAAPDPAAISIGSAGAPVELTLDPHWQFLKFTYFDRRLKSRLAIPLGTLLLEGFRDVNAMFVTNPDTSSNWTVSTPNECQCLPWILQSPKKPDDKVLIQFETEDNTFVQSSAGGSRQIVTGDPRNKPNAGRLDFYDVPKSWKSRQYFCRLSATDGDRFEKQAAKPSSAAQPLSFSLDDIVLTDKDLALVGWKPDDRAAIFANTFATGTNLSPIGVYKPDDKEPYLSKKPDIEKDRNYIADYPDWTRLVVAQGDLYDVFHKRTPDKDGQVVGARAGVRWDPVANAGRRFPNGDLTPRPDPTPTPPGEFFIVQSFFRQEHISQLNATPPGDSFGIPSIGRFDLAILRCCDAAGAQEKAISLHYFRFNFDFSPPADPHFTSSPNTVAGADQLAFGTAAAQNISNRWNGKDDQSPDSGFLVPVDTSANNLEARVLWFVQAVPKPADAHYKIDIFKEVRAHMNSSSGHGALQQDENVEDTVDDQQKGKSKGAFTAAHESGHGDSLNDEYVELALNASYFQPGFEDSIPGSPYDADEKSMMRGNKEPRPRHFWHVAEWLNALYGFPFEVKLGKLQYKLPANPDFPKQRRSFVNWPLKKALNTESGVIPDSIGNKIGTGKYDLYLYPLGLEKYNNEILPHGGALPGGHANGLLMVKVKMVFSFLDTNELFPIFNFVQKVVAGVSKRFNETNRFFFTSAAEATISPCLIRFSPRILVRNFVDTDFVKKAMGVKDAKEYQAKVQSLISQQGSDFEIEVREKPGTRWSSIVVPAPSGIGFTSELRLTFSTDGDVDPAIAFPKFFAGMVGVATGNEGASDASINSAASYQAVARKLIPDAAVQRMA